MCQIRNTIISYDINELTLFALPNKSVCDTLNFRSRADFGLSFVFWKIPGFELKVNEYSNASSRYDGIVNRKQSRSKARLKLLAVSRDACAIVAEQTIPYWNS